MHSQRLSGVFAPITTPFRENGDLDLDGLARNMEFYAASPLQGYLALGSNGENKSLIGDEKEAVIKTIVGKKAKSQVVMVGCIAESTRETIAFARRAEDLGADYLTLLSPSYFKKQMTDEALETYFTTVASSVGKPCLVYCAPQFTGGITLSAGLIAKVAAHPNIVGMKDSSTGNIDNYLMAAPEGFAVMAGSANFWLTSMLSGATGGVISLGNVFPKIVGELYDLFMKRDYEAMFSLNRKILCLNKGVSGKGGVAAVKAAMDMAGLIGGNPRLPLLPLPNKDREALEQFLRSKGMI